MLSLSLSLSLSFVTFNYFSIFLSTIFNITTISYTKMVLISKKKKKKNKHRKRTWDREDDLYIHLQDNINNNNNNNNNLNFFKNLLNKFVVNNPKADSELMQFTDGSSNIIQSHILHLQDQNRDNNNTAEENNTENEDEPQNRFLLEHMKPHGKSHVLEIVKDGVFVTYEEESSCENHKGKLSVKKSKGKKSVKGKKLKGSAKLSAKGKKRGRKRKIVNVNEEGVDSAVKVPCIEEVTVKTEILDYANEVDADYDYDDVQIMTVESPADNEVNPRKMTEFRVKLMNELNRPYSKEEHEKLLRDIRVQKPVQNYKDLRGRIKIYEEDRAGKSYLEHNLDLAKQIKAARDDPPKELCLLRGFFFWLSNSTLEGGFMPWRVPSCLDEWYHNNRKG